MNFDDIKKLSKDPEGNIDQITILMLSLDKDSYVNSIKNSSNLENNKINNQKDNNISEEDDISENEEDEIINLTKKTENINISDEMEIESYDASYEEDVTQKKL